MISRGAEAVTGLIRRRPVRFLLVGVLNTLVGYGLFAICLAIGLWPSAALIVATVLGVVFNFVSTGRLVFGSKSLLRLPAFALANGVVLSLNVLGLHALVASGLSPLSAQAGLVLPAATLSYMLQRDLVFRFSGGAWI